MTQPQTRINEILWDEAEVAVNRIFGDNDTLPDELRRPMILKEYQKRLFEWMNNADQDQLEQWNEIEEGEDD